MCVDSWGIMRPTIWWAGDNFEEVSEYLLDHYILPRNPFVEDEDVEEYFCQEVVDNGGDSTNCIVVKENNRFDRKDCKLWWNIFPKAWFITNVNHLFTYSNEEFSKYFKLLEEGKDYRVVEGGEPIPIDKPFPPPIYFEPASVASRNKIIESMKNAAYV